MQAVCAALVLLFMGPLRAFPKDRSSTDACAGDPNRYYDEDAGRCCYRCPSGLSQKKQCLQGPADCEKKCEPDYYLNENHHCTACVSCSRGYLVEKMPCTRNSSRVCECQPGMFCATPATNTCARCSPHTICSPGMIVKVQGTAERDTVCERAPPGTHLGCSTSPEDCKALESARATSLGEGPVHSPEDASELTRPPHSSSSAGKSSPNPGPSPQQPCPQGSTNCRKQCEPDYYLNEAGHCTACVSCSRDDLVEKTPCTWNSPRICECRPGMYCATSATNSCARCVISPMCQEVAVKLQGTASGDTTSKLPPLGTHPDCLTNLEDREIPSSSNTPAQMSPLDSQTSKRHGGSTTHAGEDTSAPTSAPVPVSSIEKPVLVAGPVLFCVTMVLLVLVVSGSVLLCYWKACRKGIQQKLYLCFPGRNFRRMPVHTDSRPERKLTQPCKSMLVMEPGSEEQGLMSVPAVETCPRVGTTSLENLRLLEDSPVEDLSSPRDIPEPRLTTEHTNNKIEKIYIMKADTVIVGTVRTEAPESRSPPVPVGPEFEEELEVDYVPHYPEQETEQPLDSFRDVMFSVEEEGKEESLATTISEK